MSVCVCKCSVQSIQFSYKIECKTPGLLRCRSGGGARLSRVGGDRDGRAKGALRSGGHGEVVRLEHGGTP
jgi:hypothetical protein